MKRKGTEQVPVFQRTVERSFVPCNVGHTGFPMLSIAADTVCFVERALW